MGVLGEKEQRFVVRNLKLWTKIGLEAKHRHDFQEPGLLGTAGERPARNTWPGSQGRNSLCASRLCRLEKKVRGYYKDYVFHTLFPKKTSYLTALHGLLRIIDQKSRIWDYSENLECMTVMLWGR